MKARSMVTSLAACFVALTCCFTQDAIMGTWKLNGGLAVNVGLERATGSRALSPVTLALNYIHRSTQASNMSRAV
jgi:hypothetical protein